MKAISVAIMMAVVTGSGCSDQMSGQVSFKDSISPILNAHCAECHKAQDQGQGIASSGFSTDSYESLMKGTKYGPVVVPGDSASSTLYRLIGHKADPKIQMPPHHDTTVASKTTQALTEEQIDSIKKWIDQGAKNN